MSNQPIEVTCTSLDQDGNGIVIAEGLQMPIPTLLPGETALIKSNGRWDKPGGRIVKLLKPAKERANPRCSQFLKCSGCQLLHLHYPAQLAWKQQTVEKLLSPYGTVRPILGMKEPNHYRNKVVGTFTTEGKRSVSGLYQANTHQVVPIDACQLNSPLADAIICTVRGLLKDFKIRPYNEVTEQGLLRHVLVRQGFASGQVMVVLVTGGPILPAKKNLVTALRKAHPEITTVIQNINNKATSVVLGDRENVIFGPGYIEDTLCGKVFRISSKSFYLVNPTQTKVLYEKAIALAGLTGRETVIDAYCGVGTIALMAAEKSKKVLGVDANKAAIRDAIANARRNNCKNTRFYADDVSNFVSAMAEEGEKADVLFLDPPRAGSDEAFLDAVTKLAPKKVVYISSNPFTLARDLAYLTQHGYRVEEMQPVDMAPHTTPVECVVSMTHCD